MSKVPVHKRSSALTGSQLVGIHLGSPGILCPGYHALADAPEVAAAIWRIADMVASMPLYLMRNESNGNVRIHNALSRKLDIDPWSLGTRQDFIGWIVSTMIQTGNACVLPVTQGGQLLDLVPMPDAQVQLRPDGSPYEIIWNGYAFEPDEVLHYRLRPDVRRPWLGLSPAVQLQPVVDSIMQTAETKRAYMSSEYKPPLIVAVNSDADLSDPEKRQTFTEQLLKRSDPNAPLIIPADMMTVTQARPLSLTDLAIRDGVELDKKDAAALVGVPGFMVGVGAFNRDEYHTFLATIIRKYSQIIEQENTKKLLLSDDLFCRFSSRDLYAYDLKELYAIGSDAYTKAIMTRNEVRSWVQLPPVKGGDELIALENYIPADRLGDQKKLLQEDDNAEE